MCFFDRLLRRQHEIAREAWEADDQPTGFRWVAPRDPSRLFWVRDSGTRFWAREKAIWRWILTSPEWILLDPEARRLQRRLRQLYLAGIGAWLILVVCVFSGVATR